MIHEDVSCLATLNQWTSSITKIETAMLMIGDFLRRCYLETCFTTFGTDSQQHTVHSFLLKLWTCSTAAATKKTIRLLSLFKPPGAGHHADGCQIPLMQWCRTLRVCYLLIDANVETYPFCREYTHSVQRHHVVKIWVRRLNWYSKKFHQGLGVSCSAAYLQPWRQRNQPSMLTCPRRMLWHDIRPQKNPKRKFCSVSIWNATWNIFKVTSKAPCWCFGSTCTFLLTQNSYVSQFRFAGFFNARWRVLDPLTKHQQSSRPRSTLSKSRSQHPGAQVV